MKFSTGTDKKKRFFACGIPRCFCLFSGKKIRNFLDSKRKITNEVKKAAPEKCYRYSSEQREFGCSLCHKNSLVCHCGCAFKLQMMASFLKIIQRGNAYADFDFAVI